MSASARRRLAGAALAAGLVAAACGGGDGGQSAVEEFGFGLDEFGLPFDQLVERAEAVEVAIGECMEAAGFEYVPNDWGTVEDAMGADKSARGLSDSEFVEQFGFGISTQFPKPIVEEGLGEENAGILSSLGPADQEAYRRTLWGDNQEQVLAYALELEDLSKTGGCTREAAARFFTEEEMSATFFNPADALIEEDPRAQQAIQDFVECMKEGGFDVAHPDDVEDGLTDDVEAITGGEDPTSLSGEAAERLRELQTFELAIAPVFVRCEEDVLDPVLETIEDEIFG